MENRVIKNKLLFLLCILPSFLITGYLVFLFGSLIEFLNEPLSEFLNEFSNEFWFKSIFVLFVFFLTIFFSYLIYKINSIVEKWWSKVDSKKVLFIIFKRLFDVFFVLFLVFGNIFGLIGLFGFIIGISGGK